MAVLRSPWNYIDHLDEFLEWAVHAGTVTRLFNPVEVVQWNTHKGYLRQLAKQGVPVVPTAWLGVGESSTSATVSWPTRAGTTSWPNP